MKKLLLYIFIPVLSVLLMSHNTHAVDTVFDMTTYEPVIRQVYDRVDCSILNVRTGVTTNTSNQHFCSVSAGNDYALGSITTHNNLSYKKGDIIEFDLISFSEGSLYDSNYFKFETPYLNDNTNFRIMSYKDVSSGYYFDIATINSNTGSIGAGVQFYKVIRFTIYVNNDFTGVVGFTSPNVAQHPIATFGQNQLSPVYSNIVNLVVYRNRSDGQSQDQKNEINETNNAVQGSETSGSSSSSDSQNATSSLLSVFTGFASVITNASATNCVINAPLNTSFGDDRLNVDLCSLSLPPALGALTSIIAVMVIVPFAISMFNKFIAIMESFQR